MKSLFPDIFSDDLVRSKEFYVSLFGFETVFEIDWYIQLQSPDDENLQIAFVRRNHASVPVPYQERPQGIAVTIETDDVDTVHDRATELGFEIVYPLVDEAFGQRHFMTVDPNGLLVDVVRMIEPTREFLVEHGLA